MDEGPGDAKRSAGVRGLTARQAVDAKNLTFEVRKAIIIYKQGVTGAPGGNGLN